MRGLAIVGLVMLVIAGAIGVWVVWHDARNASITVALPPPARPPEAPAVGAAVAIPAPPVAPPPAPVLPADPPRVGPPVVDRLSAVPPLDWQNFLRAYADVSEGTQSWPVEAWSMLSDCQAAEAARGQPAAQAALAERSRAALAGGGRRLRLAVATPGTVLDAALVVPVPGAGAAFSQSLQPAVLCAGRFGVGGIPRLILLQTSEPAPWDRRVPIDAATRQLLEAAPVSQLPSDLVLDIVGPGGIGIDGVLYVPVRMVALYLWRDEARTQAIAALGRVGPDSHDRPVAAAPAPPRAVRPPGPRAADAPPASAAPRAGVEVQSLPPPLAVERVPQPPTAALRATHVAQQDAALRAAPSLQADRVGVVRAGERLAIDGTATGPDGIPWLATRLPDGRRVWVSGRLMRAVEPAP
jgi:hypothetical protein